MKAKTRNVAMAATLIPGDSDIATNVLQQPDGKLVVGRGNDAVNDDFSVLRSNAGGTPDATFDGDGRTSLDVPGVKGGTTHVVLLQADGKIIAAGSAHDAANPFSSDRDFALVRYNQDGSPDTTFGVGGVVVHDAGGWDEIYSIVQQSDGRLVAGGIGWDDMTFVRFNANGNVPLDTLKSAPLVALPSAVA